MLGCDLVTTGMHLEDTASAAAKSLQSCLTLCDPIDGSPPGSPVPGILQARTLEWVAIPSPMHESEKGKWSLSVLSNPQWPHGLQPSRLLHPWDFPGKSTGVGCHCLLREGTMLREIKWTHSVVSNSATPWTVAHQAPPSTGFSRQEYWRGLPFPSPGDLPNSGIKPRSPVLQADDLLSEPPGRPH